MSVKGKICISEFDLKRLKELIKVAEEFGDKRVVQYLEELDEELDRADVVKPQEIRNDVSAKGKISILAPIGTAVLGYRLGDTIEWEVPAGLKTFKVEEIVYQPEAAGDYHR
jgi:regulator of nucleoside diphosphate kinase